MKCFEVQLSSIAQIKHFVKAACTENLEVGVVYRNSRINAKSIMSMFSLDLTKPLTIEALGEQEACEAFYRDVKDFVVTESMA